MSSRVRWYMIAVCSVLCLSYEGNAVAGGPTDFIKDTTDDILQIFEASQLQGSDQRAQRLARLHHIADTAFDWEEIARRALATHWHERTPAERQEFVGLFKDTVLGTYLKRLEEAAPQGLREKQDILYRGEQVDGSRAVVNTTVVTKRHQEIPISYRLRRSNGQWRIYDVVVEGVSLVNNYRVQFHRIITTSSYQALVQQMRAKQPEDARTGPSATPR